MSSESCPPSRKGNRMSQFPSIPNLELLELFKKFPGRGILPLQEYHDAILRNESELTVGERGLTAAYVSSLNDCHYFFCAHRDHAKFLGIPAEMFGNVQIDLDHPGIDARMRRVLSFVHRLTLDLAWASGCAGCLRRRVHRSGPLPHHLGHGVLQFHEPDSGGRRDQAACAGGGHDRQDAPQVSPHPPVENDLQRRGRAGSVRKVKQCSNRRRRDRGKILGLLARTRAQHDPACRCCGKPGGGIRGNGRIGAPSGLAQPFGQ